MPIDFYYAPGSAACRAVIMTARAVGVDLKLILTNPMNGDTRKPEFLKINPQHCIPTINDNGFVLWESRAILGYLVDQYGKNDTLYPKDAKKRALVNQRLYFDMNILYQRFAEYYYPIALAGAEADPAKFTKIEEAFAFLDKFLEGQDWVAGSNMTIADISIVSNVSSSEVLEFDISKYPNVNKWLARAKKTILDYEDLNREGIALYKEYFQKLLSAKKGKDS